MKNIKNSLPNFDTDVLVYNIKLKAFQIDNRHKSDMGSGGWSWRLNSKYDISHWEYLPSKPI